MSNPRRTQVARPEPGETLSLMTNMVLKKGATFHSPTSDSPSCGLAPFSPPSLLHRSQTNLDDVVDAHRRRVALALGDINKSLAGLNLSSDASSSPAKKSFRDNSLPLPRGFLDHTLGTMTEEPAEADKERRILRPRSSRRSSRFHESDSGLGTSVGSGKVKPIDTTGKNKKPAKISTVTRSAAGSSVTAEELPVLSQKARNRIYEHVLKPILAKSSLKGFHNLILECPRRIQNKEIVCLRDLEKTLLLVAPNKTKAADLYLDFCLTSIRCIQATVEYLSEREQTRPRDLPYTNGYFIDLVDQVKQYARQLADAKDKDTASSKTDTMDVDPSDEIRLHGGIHENGRPAELIRVKKNGKAISIATGETVEDLDEETKGLIRFKRSMSEQAEDEEEIMRSMARRKKNASAAELAPKKCREPGCNKEFKRPCDLTKHEKTHSRPWKCPVPTCKYHEYGWPTEKEMDRHHNDKHSSAPPMYCCQFTPCPYKSKRESNCKQHMEKAHGWTYVRTKTNGKRGMDMPLNTMMQGGPADGIPTPISDRSGGLATPPQHHYDPAYNQMEFPSYVSDEEFSALLPRNQQYAPDDIQLDYSPVDGATPSTDSGFDHHSAYQGEMGVYNSNEDIYNANHVQMPPTPTHLPYGKEMAHHFQNYPVATASEMQVLHTVTQGFSPAGQGNTMLYTPSSLADVDEGFDEVPSSGRNFGTDFPLYSAGNMAKQNVYPPLFPSEVPSAAAGYSQPASQDIVNYQWPSGYTSSYGSPQ